MIDFKPAIDQYYNRLIDVINKLDREELNIAMNAIYDTYMRDGYIYICGNGGSAATASHFANDFNKGISEHIPKKFRFHCLNDNFATIMAIANDSSYDDVFSMQLENIITKNDLVILISGSGNSKNIVKALEYSKSQGVKTLGISGYDGGILRKESDFHMHADIKDMQIAEDLHMTFDHMMMKIFYNLLVKNENTGENI